MKYLESRPVLWMVIMICSYYLLLSFSWEHIKHEAWQWQNDLQKGVRLPEATRRVLLRTVDWVGHQPVIAIFLGVFLFALGMLIVAVYSAS